MRVGGYRFDFKTHAVPFGSIAKGIAQEIYEDTDDEFVIALYGGQVRWQDNFQTPVGGHYQCFQTVLQVFHHFWQENWFKFKAQCSRFDPRCVKEVVNHSYESFNLLIS